MINNFYAKHQEMFYNQPFSNNYLQKIQSLPFENQTYFISYCYYNLFNSEYNKIKLDIESKDKILYEEKEKYQYLNLDNRFARLTKTMEEIVNFDKGINKFFKNLKQLKIDNKDHILSKRTFYRFKDEFIKKLAKIEINFQNLFQKSKRPINPYCKYTEKQKIAIAQYVKAQIEFKYDNMQNIWLKLCKDNVLGHIGDFSSITYKTMIKIYLEYEGKYMYNVSKVSKRHVLRKYILSPGNTQMDLKILGVNENGLKNKITIFNVIDIATRIVFSKVLRDGTSINIIEALNEAYEFYSSIGIKIISMQTDNAMMFKDTNFIATTSYKKWLKERNIIKRNIKLGHPQSNGCIERYHKTIDDECKWSLKLCQTFEDVYNVIKVFSIYYNYSRYHYYHELSQKRYDVRYKDRFMIPIQSIQRIQELSKITS